MKRQLIVKIEHKPHREELSYNAQAEDFRNEQRQLIKNETADCIKRAEQHKKTQDSLMSKSKILQDKLYELRQQLTREQSFKFNEWTEFEAKVADRNQTIRKLTEDQL